MKGPRIILLILWAAFAGGCASTIELRPWRDPQGQTLTDSYGCVYDVDSAGFWYVVFIRCDGLLDSVHRHNPGMHLFVRKNDLIFYSRCSGRGEVIDIMGKTFWLKEGRAFLCRVVAGQPQVSQLNVEIRPCRWDDAPGIEQALGDLANEPPVAAFLSPEARARLMLHR